MYRRRFMKIAHQLTVMNAVNGYQSGGPFGAVVVKNDKIVGVGYNHVIENHDPTAHAEVQAIRDACKKLNTHDLSGCELYTSCYPCPMCLCATIWSNIKKVYYGNTQEDADKIGFRDKEMYDMFKDIKNNKLVELSQHDHNITIESFNDFAHHLEAVLY